jgi:hypothetical protein
MKYEEGLEVDIILFQTHLFDFLYVFKTLIVSNEDVMISKNWKV